MSQPKTGELVILDRVRNEASELCVLATFEEAIKEFTAKPKDKRPKKALIIWVDDNEEDDYDTRWFNAGMRGTEIVALCHTVVHEIMNMVTAKE